jgi:hypothetical protein
MQQGNSCPYCRTTLKPGVKFCQGCGSSIANINAPQSNWPPYQQGEWKTQQPQPPMWGAPPQQRWQQPNWAPRSNAILSQLTSRRSLLLMVLLVLIITIFGIVIWQFSSKPDTSLPAISGVAVSFAGKTSAKVIWQTDKPCSSQVEYGRTTQYGYLEPAIPQTGGLTEHSISLNNLRAGSTYHYRVRSKDANRKESISNDFSFKTQAESPFVMPD